MSQAEVSPDPQSSSPQSSSSKPVEAESAVDSLKAMVEGLTWMSESDYPFEVAQLPDRAAPVAIAELLQLRGHEADTPIEEISVQNFFAPVIQPQDWYEEADTQRMHRFQALLQWIEQHLGDVRVYRIGTIEINVYITGKTEAGAWISLSTKVIET